MDVHDVLERKVRASLGVGGKRDVARTRRELEAFDAKMRFEDEAGDYDEGKDCERRCRDEDEDESDKDGVVSAAVRADLAWSDEALDFEKLKRTSLAHVVTNVRTLRLQHCSITDLGQRLDGFASLRELNVSGNELTRIGNCLPPGLQSLQAFDNAISVADVVAPHLVHLGLGFNPVSSLVGLGALACLESLDVSYTSLVDIDGTIDCLSQLPNLRILHVQGNPFCLLAGYRTAFTSAMAALEDLNGRNVEADAAEALPLLTSFAMSVGIESVAWPSPAQEPEGEAADPRPEVYYLEVFLPNGSTQRSEQAELSVEGTMDFAFVAAITAKPCVSVRDAIDLKGVTVTLTALLPPAPSSDNDDDDESLKKATETKGANDGDGDGDGDGDDEEGKEAAAEEQETLLRIGAAVVLDLKALFEPSSDGRCEFVRQAAFGTTGATATVCIKLNPIVNNDDDEDDKDAAES